MKLEVAKNMLHNIRAKNIQASSCSLADQEDKRNWGEEIEAIDVILEELSKKDKVIDLMAKWIEDHEGPFEESLGSEKCEIIKSVLCIGKTDTCKECIKKGFYKKVEEQEQ